MTAPKPAVVRVYFDADVLGLAKLLCRLRADFTYPGDPGARIKNRAEQGPYIRILSRTGRLRSVDLAA